MMVITVTTIIIIIIIIMMIVINYHGSHIDLHIESPPTWHFKYTQPFRNSGAEQRQGCTEHVKTIILDVS